MARYSKTIAAVVKKDPRLESYDADLDGHWIVTADGFTYDGTGRIIHEMSVKGGFGERRRDIQGFVGIRKCLEVIRDVTPEEK